jgi:hypothetical protein
VPLLNALHTCMIDSVSQIEKKSELAEAFRYSLNRWDALCRYTQDGRLEIDNNIEELLPWNVADRLNQPTQVTAALAAR